MYMYIRADMHVHIACRHACTYRVLNTVAVAFTATVAYIYSVSNTVFFSLHNLLTATTATECLYVCIGLYVYCHAYIHLYSVSNTLPLQLLNKYIHICTCLHTYIHTRMCSTSNRVGVVVVNK
jgi:hypothetical protein